jgi:hypothetical protein
MFISGGIYLAWHRFGETILFDHIYRNNVVVPVPSGLCEMICSFGLKAQQWGINEMRAQEACAILGIFVTLSQCNLNRILARMSVISYVFERHSVLNYSDKLHDQRNSAIRYPIYSPKYDYTPHVVSFKAKLYCGCGEVGYELSLVSPSPFFR